MVTWPPPLSCSCVFGVAAAIIIILGRLLSLRVDMTEEGGPPPYRAERFFEEDDEDGVSTFLAI